MKSNLKIINNLINMNLNNTYMLVYNTRGKDLKYSSLESDPRKFEFIRRIAKDLDELL